MAAKVLIDFEANLGNLEAAISKIEQGSDQLSESAAQAGKKVSEEYRKVASSAKAAFASQEVNNALKSQVDNVDKLADELKRLYDEEVRLLTQNKQNTAEFTKNAKAIEAARKQFDGLKSGVQTLNKELPKTAQEIAKLEDELKALALEGKQGTQEFNDIARAIGEYRAAITTADRAVDLYAKSTDAATGRLGELEDKLYDLALAGQTNTQEFKDTIAEVTKLKRAVFEVDQQVDSYVERSRGLTAVVQNVELVGNAFQIVEGATAAFGVENEDLQETLVRLNAIIAVTNGLEQVRTILLDQSVKKTGLAAIAQRGYTLAVGTSTGALKAFRLAIAATGVGLLFIALGSLISRLGESKQAFDDAANSVNDYQDAINKLNQEGLAAQQRLAAAQIKNLQLEGRISDQAAENLLRNNKLQSDIINNNIAAKEKETAALQRFEEQKAKDIEFFGKVTNATRQQLNDDLLAIETQRATIEKALRLEAVNDAIESNRKIKDETVKRVRTEITELETLQAKQIEIAQESLAITDNSTDAYNAFLRTREQQLIRQIALEENANESSLESTKELIRIQGELEKQQARATITNAEELAATINRIDTETQLKIKEARRQANEELIQEITQYVGAVQQSFNAIADLQRASTEQRIEQINRLRDVELEAINVASKSEAQKQREREALELRTNRKIIEERRKIARLNKAQGVFDAVINTAVAVTNALKQDFPLNIILAAAAGVAGGTQIAKISSEPLPSFGKGGWIDGEPHSRGGVDINAEGGEFVTRASEARKNRKELEAMNTSRAAFLKLIENNYVKPRLMAATLERGRDGVNVNVNARLNSSAMETELRELRRETRKNGKIMQKVLTGATSSRYSW
jgi:chromosome segregation ATPase